MALNNLYNKIVKLQMFDAAETVAAIINANGPYIAELLRTQLRRGVDADNQPITLIRNAVEYPFYSDYTVMLKERKGQQTDYVTLHDSGIFYLSIRTIASAQTESFSLLSDVPYFPDILLKVGTHDRVMELSKDNLEILTNNVIKPQFALAFEVAMGQ